MSHQSLFLVFPCCLKMFRSLMAALTGCRNAGVERAAGLNEGGHHKPYLWSPYHMEKRWGEKLKNRGSGEVLKGE